MAKKRKLNSKNPKYNKDVGETRIIEKRELFCTITKGSSKIPVHGVWYK